MAIITNKSLAVYLALCLIGIFFHIPETAKSQLSTVWDRLYISFYGFTEQGFSIISFLFYCIVFLGFTYLFQNYLSIVLTERIYYQLIRYQSINKWFLHNLKFVFGMAILLLITLFCITIVAGFIDGKSLSLSLSIAPKVSVPELMYHYFINGLMQLMNYVLISFIVMWIWKKNEYQLVTLGVFMVLSLPFVNNKLIFPSGLNSLGHINGNEFVIIKISMVLLMYFIIELLIINYLFKKRGVIF